MCRLVQQTSALFMQANADSNVRVVVLSARGKAFSAGLDRIPVHSAQLILL